MSKITLTPIVNLENQTTAVNAITTNNAVLTTAFDNTLSRDGRSPNQMSASLDMNSNRILNLAAPASQNEPLRLQDFNTLTGGPATFSSLPTGGVKGQALVKNSISNYDVVWGGGVTVTPEQFGANIYPVGTAIGSMLDSTTAFGTAIAYLASLGGGTLQLGVGMYSVSNISISNTGIYIKGAGTDATFILHTLTANGSCFVFSAGASILFDTGISDLSIVSNDTTYNKIAINVSDVSAFYCRDIFISHWPIDGTMYRGPGTSGTGLFVQGREHGKVERVQAYANIPLNIAVNPNSAAISIDSWRFSDNLWYTTSATNDCITIDTGVCLFNTVMDGAQNWIGGRDGLRWVDTSTTIESDGLYISGVKAEQAADVTGFTVNIQHNTGLKGFRFANSIGGDRNGFFLRKVVHPTLSNFSYQQTAGLGLNLDATCITLKIDHCFWWPPATASISGLFVARQCATPSDGNPNLPTDAFYTTSSNPEKFQSLSTLAGVQVFSTTAVPAGGAAGTGISMSSSANLGVFFGSGVPTLSAAQGSLYVRTDGSSTTTRMYVNTNGSTAWTGVTTVS